MNYWSNSSFANWIRKIKKPYYVTLDQWKRWEDIYKERYPIRYYITEILLDKIQNIVNYPYKQIIRIKKYFINIIDKTHILYSPNNEIGKWHEIGDRMLECNFQALVDYVEKQCASVRGYDRSELEGTKYLLWEMNLVCDESMGVDRNNVNYGYPTHQAEVAKKVYELYVWWKVIRNNRIDIWGKHYKDIVDGYHFMLDEMYSNEDTDKLVELIKIRNDLWT